MAMGRGSAIMFLALVVLAFVSEIEGTEYKVGDTSLGWPSRRYGSLFRSSRARRLKAGDFLVFNYDKKQHDVVSVSYSEYKTCTVSRKTRRPKVFRSGKDRIMLNKGLNFFICSIQGHCQAGMKIAVYVN